MKNWWVLIVIFLILAGAGFGIWYWYKKKKEGEVIPAGTPVAPTPTSPSYPPTQEITTPPTPSTPVQEKTIFGTIAKVAMPAEAVPGADINIAVSYETSFPTAITYSSMVTVTGNGQFKYDTGREWGATNDHDMNFVLKMQNTAMTITIKLFAHDKFTASPSESGWQLLQEIIKTVTPKAGSISVVTPPGVDPTQPIAVPEISAAITILRFDKDWLKNIMLVVTVQGVNPGAMAWATRLDITGPGIFLQDKTREYGAGSSYNQSFNLGKAALNSTFSVRLYASEYASATFADVAKWKLMDTKSATYKGV